MFHETNKFVGDLHTSFKYNNHSVTKLIWVFPKIGVGPQNGWFIMEIHISKWMIWGENPPFSETPIPSRELTYSTCGKGKSSTQNAIFGGYVSSLEGIHLIHDTNPIKPLAFSKPHLPWLTRHQRFVGNLSRNLSQHSWLSYKVGPTKNSYKWRDMGDI